MSTTSTPPGPSADYLRGYAEALHRAAFYVRDHCAQGEEHADIIRELKRPDGVPAGYNGVTTHPEFGRNAGVAPFQEVTEAMVQAAYGKVYGITRSDISPELVRTVCTDALTLALAAGVAAAPAPDPRMAFCPACFVEVSAAEADQQTLDARKWREHVAGVQGHQNSCSNSSSTSGVPVPGGVTISPADADAYTLALRVARSGRVFAPPVEKLLNELQALLEGNDAR